MSAGPQAKEQHDRLEARPHPQHAAEKLPGNGSAGASASDELADDNNTDNHRDSDEEEDEEEDEPRLKYSKLTGGLASVYRNGDATSCFLLAGDKMIVGTHNGSIHVLSLPSLQSLRLYRAHSASVTALSVSPLVSPFLPQRQEGSARFAPSRMPSSAISPSLQATNAPSTRTPKQQPPIPSTPSNLIHIASASIDGHVCVSALVDTKDVTLRNFARPVQAVALSPEFKADRTYISGGLAGNLILTVGGKAGVSADANTNSAAAAASGWLGSIGLGQNTGRDTVLHSGEGSISTIKFSHTAKFVAWVNEQGIKIMRSHLKLESADSDSAWKRIAHVDRPNRKGWEDMAGVWKGRIEWIDDNALETEEDSPRPPNGEDHPKSQTPTSRKKRPEKLLVGWGDTAWLLHVHSGGAGVGKHVGERSVGSADIVHKLTFDDCVVSGLSLYTPSLLAVLAYRTRDDDDNPISSSLQNTPKRGRHHRQSGLQPELRLINVASGEEVDVDTLTMSRFESLSAADYQMGTLYVPLPQRPVPAHRGTFEGFGAGLWDASTNATRLLGSSASILSTASSDENGKSSTRSPLPGSAGNARVMAPSRKPSDTNPFLSRTGLKILIQSPYDCVLAIKRELSDHLSWLLERQQYGNAWDLINDHPTVIAPSTDRQSMPSSPSSPSKAQTSLADFFADESASQSTFSAGKSQNSAVAKEKRRVGDLWLQQLVAKEDWATAGKVAGKVLGTSSRWEYWVMAFAQAGRFDEITPFIPSTDIKPALPSFVYEVVLGHYIGHDRPRFSELLDKWDPELFDINSVRTAIEDKLQSGDVSETTVEDDEQGRDWRILLDGLAKLHLADGRPRDALRCHIRLQNADAAMALIRDYHLGDAISDDIPGLLMLRVSKDQMKTASIEDLEEASSEVVHLLVDEAYTGVVRPDTVVSQLVHEDATYRPFLFFYFRCLWQGPSAKDQDIVSRADRLKYSQQTEEGRLSIDNYGDLAVSLFADYDRDLLMDFLRSSDSYTYEQASHICEEKHYIPELVYLLSKTGQTKNALFLIIRELEDVSQAISFTKENPDLWDDLLDYSMSKPNFIRALLEEVGTSINPITLVRRIPNGLEIEGLREGIGKMIREYEIQHSISDGVAKVLRGEVGTGMDALRAGQKKAVKFDVAHESTGEVEIFVEPVQGPDGSGGVESAAEYDQDLKPGHCVGCKDVFDQDEKETLVGFACGHVFHLSCLLDATDGADQADIETLQGQAPMDDGGADRSVRAKVKHAFDIKSAIRGGCPRCVLPEGAD
ncbi:hypothetical protein MBLNU459_g2048t1 [Dothideomycetes sp. NU459]